MKRREALGAFLTLLLLPLPGCSRPTGPADPVWGKEPCAHCAMVVGDPRYAAQLVMADGERRHFDDIGCMIAFLDRRRPPVVHSWVRDAGRGVWIDAESARYASGARTPMDYGFVAQAGGPLSLPDVRQAVLHRERGPS